MQVVNACKSYGNQADGSYAANAWTDRSEKLKIILRPVEDGALYSLYNVIPG